MGKPMARVQLDNPLRTEWQPVCCNDMSQAFDDGTDSEGYEPLLCERDGMIDVGDGLSNIEYCPWCGKKIDWDWLG